MKTIPKQYAGGEVLGWTSNDPAQLYWYKSEWTGSDKSQTEPETITAAIIGHTGIVMPDSAEIRLDDLEFIAAGLFGEPRGARIKWTGDSYRYGIYQLKSRPDRFLIIRQDGGGLYAYLDCGHTDWRAICSLLTPERIWDLCQVIGHTYEQGRDHERQKLFHLFAANKIKRAKIRGQNAFRVSIAA